MDKINNFQNPKTKTPYEEEEEEEEEEDMEEEKALSLSDFPLYSDQPEKRDSFKTQDKRRSSSEPSEFFEFFNQFTSDDNMSNAEDIIFRGKLVPYKIQPRQLILKSLSADDATRKYFDLNSKRSIGNGRSRDCKKLRRNSRMLMKSEASDIHRSFSRGSAKSDGVTRVSKPWWFVLMFGPLKFQQEMDLRDMKNRQVRRIPGSMFPGIDGAGGKIPASRSDHRRSSWGYDLLRVLSCKNHASVAVTASIGLVPHF